MIASDAATNRITFDGVGKRFDDTWVLEDVDLHVAPGTIMGLIGPSGSGKTTTVRLANGYYEASAGEVRILGSDPAKLTDAQRRRIGYLPQRLVLFDELSLWENLNFHASLNGVAFRRRARLNELLELVQLKGQEKKLVSESSGGMQRRLALAATLVHSPDVLMLDEPTAGIDPILRRRFWEYFRTLRDAGRTLVITTQSVSEAADCDVVVMLAQGRIAACGSPTELRRQALGGTSVEVTFEQHVGADVVDRLARIEGVERAELVDFRTVLISIDQERITIADIGEQLGDPWTISKEGEVATDWDEVFIELVGADSSDDVDVVAGTDESAAGDGEIPDTTKSVVADPNGASE